MEVMKTHFCVFLPAAKFAWVSPQSQHPIALLYKFCQILGYGDSTLCYDSSADILFPDNHACLLFWCCPFS